MQVELESQTDMSAGDLHPPEPPTEPQEQIEEDLIEIDSFRRPTSFAELDPGILEKIFNHVPAQERLVVAAVCRPWRQTFLGTSSCWAGIRLGQNSNCFSSSSLSTRPPDLLPLSHIQEVTLTPAIPAAVNGFLCPVTDQLKEIPYLYLSLVLGHAHKLRKLDMSSLLLKDDNVADFRLYPLTRRILRPI